MPFIVKLDSLTVVARTASEAVGIVETFLGDDATAEPVISTLDGVPMAIDQLRQIVAGIDEG